MINGTGRRALEPYHHKHVLSIDIGLDPLKDFV